MVIASRRSFLGLAPAAAAGHALASSPLAKLAARAPRTTLLLSPGGGEWKTCFGPSYQAGVQRVWRLLLAHGVTVEVQHCRDRDKAGAIFPVMHVYAEYLPAALVPELQAWQRAVPGRSITFSRPGSWTDLDTPERMAAVCRL